MYLIVYQSMLPKRKTELNYDQSHYPTSHIIHTKVCWHISGNDYGTYFWSPMQFDYKPPTTICFKLSDTFGPY